MNALLKGFLFALFALVIVLAPGAVTSHASGGWGEAVGPIAGRVTRSDDPRGLTVRSGPSYSSDPLGYVAVGARVNTYGQFADGWVRIAGPVDGGWIEIANLSPVRGTAVVIGVDQPDDCLRVRSGPSSGYAVVGCVAPGQKLRLTGLWSENNWAQIDRPAMGWVYAPQISTSLVAFRSPPIVYPSGPTVYVQPPEISVYGPGFSYVYPRRGYYYGPYRHHLYRGYSHRYRPHPYQHYRGYRSSGVAVGVGPRGVGVRAGGVGVHVGPRGIGVRVR